MYLKINTFGNGLRIRIPFNDDIFSTNDNAVKK